MADTQEIELFITEEGELKVHIKGIKGSGCTKVTEAIAKAMGKQANVTLTPEYYQQNAKTDTNQRIKPA